MNNQRTWTLEIYKILVVDESVSMPMIKSGNNLHILLVEEDEDEYICMREFLNAIYSGNYSLAWEKTYEDGLRAVQHSTYQLCLFDYRLGEHSGLELTQTVVKSIANPPPMIIFASEDFAGSDINAIKSGASDYLVKQHITTTLLQRSIRYALARKEAEDARLHSERALKESELKHRTVLETITDSIITINEQGNIESINPAAEKMFGYTVEELLGKKINILMPEPYSSEHQDYLARYSEVGIRNIIGSVRELACVHKNGSKFPVELLVNEVDLNDRRLYFGSIRDISERKRVEEELRLTATAFETHTAIMIVDSTGDILRVNPAFTEITGYHSCEVIGKNPRILHSGYQDVEFYHNMWATIKDVGKWEGEIWNKRKNGEIYPEWLTITALTSIAGEVTHYVATFQDITDRKEIEALVEHQAMYDALTDLPNRRCLLDRLEQVFASAKRHLNYGALLFLDLDHFKNLNDTLGHAAGDSLLKQLALRLNMQVRVEDTVARLGGDEFVVLLSQLGHDVSDASTYAQQIAEKIKEALVQPYDLEGHEYNFTSSIGIAMFPNEDEQFMDVLKNADIAMYRSKAEGRNTIRIYQASMQEAAIVELEPEKKVRIS